MLLKLAPSNHLGTIRYPSPVPAAAGPQQGGLLHRAVPAGGAPQLHPGHLQRDQAAQGGPRHPAPRAGCSAGGSEGPRLCVVV